MKVLCVGFSKTGTKSLSAALRELGYKVYDNDETMYYLRKQWNKIFAEGGTKEDFRKMYENVDATVDIPACYFWEEILEAFPDVKLIFTQREDESKWLKSWETQVNSINGNVGFTMLTMLSPTCQSCWRFSRNMGRVIFGSNTLAPWRLFTGISPNVALKRYRDHNTCVLANAPKEQLLKFNLKDGWEPLCKFLGKPVPNKPFPHKNKSGSIVQEFYDQSPIIAVMKREAYFTSTLICLAGTSGLIYLNYKTQFLEKVFSRVCLNY